MVNVYLKRHNKTNKLYFGKTIKKDVEKYRGSGLHWKRHCKVHGLYDIHTVFVESFTDKTLLVEFCEFFSEFFDIQASTRFLNIVNENGLDGGCRNSVLVVYKDGHMRQISLSEYKNHNSIECEYVGFNSTEGKRRIGITTQHANIGTIVVYDRYENKSKRIPKQNLSERYVKFGTSEWYAVTKTSPKIKPTNDMVVLVVQNGKIAKISRSEYMNGGFMSIYSTEGKSLLNIFSSGNKKGLVTCVDMFGKIKTIGTIEYWSQKTQYGDDVTSWSYIHPTHPEGRRRKLENS